ncbi:isocitrate dehydrogenase kinase/phosphatase AceK regulatory subunit [Shigella flexneri]
MRCCQSTRRTTASYLLIPALTTTAEASIVFGFARSYFMVYAPLPQRWWSGYGKFPR